MSTSHASHKRPREEQRRLNTPRPLLEEKLSLTLEGAAAVNNQEIFLGAQRVKPQEG